MNPKYPIYIISKGRWESRLTSKALEEMGVSYSIVIEPQEYSQYSAVISPQKILVLPFSNLRQGSIPARNWVWEHSLQQGVERHWILDDNITCFWRLNRNRRLKVWTGTIFRAMEDFVGRYKNIALAGPHDEMWLPLKEKHNPLLLNSRIYSCILILNSIPYRWRGKYNEDTDLSLRVLKDRWCTVLFHAFVMDKIVTMKMKGGNTDELYQGDGRLKMAQSLKRQHPKIVKIKWKWGRWQHVVDYSSFKSNRLIKRAGVEIAEGVDNYGMVLVKR